MSLAPESLLLELGFSVPSDSIFTGLSFAVDSSLSANLDDKAYSGEVKVDSLVVAAGTNGELTIGGGGVIPSALAVDEAAEECEAGLPPEPASMRRRSLYWALSFGRMKGTPADMGWCWPTAPAPIRWCCRRRTCSMKYSGCMGTEANSGLMGMYGQAGWTAAAWRGLSESIPGPNLSSMLVSKGFGVLPNTGVLSTAC